MNWALGGTLSYRYFLGPRRLFLEFPSAGSARICTPLELPTPPRRFCFGIIRWLESQSGRSQPFNSLLISFISESTWADPAPPPPRTFYPP